MQGGTWSTLEKVVLEDLPEKVIFKLKTEGEPAMWEVVGRSSIGLEQPVQRFRGKEELDLF